MFHLKNNISHGSTNKMYTDTVVLISQLEVTSVLICNSVLITEHLATAFYGTFKNHVIYITHKRVSNRDIGKFYHGMRGLKRYHK